jgi:hypothetical protein
MTNNNFLNRVYKITHNLSERLIAVILSIFSIVLPFQTVLVTYFINKLGFPSFLALWKEGLSVILIATLTIDIIIKIVNEFFYSNNAAYQINKNSKIYTLFQKIKPQILFEISLFIISIFSFFNFISFRMFVYGFRFELFWILVASLISAWINFESDKKILSKISKVVTRSILIGFGLTSIFSIVLLIMGQSNILSSLGYGANFEAENVSNIITPPICHKIDAFQEDCRLSGGFSFPNHFGAYLIIIMGVIIYLINKTAQKLQLNFNNLIEAILTNKYNLTILLIGLITNLVLNFLTYTRFSLLAILIFVIYYVIKAVIYLFNSYFNLNLSFNSKTEISQNSNPTPNPNLVSSAIPKPNTNQTSNQFAKTNNISKYVFILNRFTLLIAILIPVFVGIIALFGSNLFINLPVFISKPASTNEHLRRLNATIEVINKEKFRLINGYGLGASGPAAKDDYLPYNQNPIFITHQNIAYNHGLVGEDLTNPENWFLQVLLNGGVIYFIFYILTLWFVFVTKYNKETNKYVLRDKAFVMSFFGLVIGNLFLHIFENQTVVMILVATLAIEVD